MTNIAVPTPYEAVPGNFLTSALWNAQIFNGLTFLLNRPLAILQQATSQSIGSSPVVLTFDSTTLDTYGGHSNTTNNSRYTGQAPGWYLVIGTGGLAANSSGNRVIQINKNGTVVNGAVQDGPAPGASNGSIVQVQSMVYLNGTSDYVEIGYYQNSGSTLASAASNCTMTVVWMHA